MGTTPSPGGERRRAAGTPAEGNGYAPSSADLAVLLNELNRVRDNGEADAQSPGEAMTLAAAAIRMVEAQLGQAGRKGLGEAELATAREALLAALDALQAAVRRVEGDGANPVTRRFRMRRRKVGDERR